MSSRLRPVISEETLSAWCQARFDSPVQEILFTAGYSSAVFGVRLQDNTPVVVKIRPWQERLVSCWRVHRHVWQAGLPCPEPLGPPQKHAGLAVSFERWLPGGDCLSRGVGTAEALGRLLAELVQAAPPAGGLPDLSPAWGFLRWNDPGDAWPPAHDIADDLNTHPEPRWIEQAARRVRPLLQECTLPHRIGHGDWWSDNIRWEDGRLLSIDDWDSAVSLPEPAIAGVGAALFAFGQSTVAESAAFLDAYAARSGQPWTAPEAQLAWAAGLWARLFDARKESIRGVSEFADQLKGEVAERLQRAGVEGGELELE